MNEKFLILAYANFRHFSHKIYLNSKKYIFNMSGKVRGKTLMWWMRTVRARRARRMRLLREEGVDLNVPQPDMIDKIRTDYNMVKLYFPNAPEKDIDMIMNGIWGEYWYQYRDYIINNKPIPVQEPKQEKPIFISIPKEEEDIDIFEEVKSTPPIGEINRDRDIFPLVAPPNEVDIYQDGINKPIQKVEDGGNWKANEEIEHEDDIWSAEWINDWDRDKKVLVKINYMLTRRNKKLVPAETIRIKEKPLPRVIEGDKPVITEEQIPVALKILKEYGLDEKCLNSIFEIIPSQTEVIKDGTA